MYLTGSCREGGREIGVDAKKGFVKGLFIVVKSGQESG